MKRPLGGVYFIYFHLQRPLKHYVNLMVSYFKLFFKFLDERLMLVAAALAGYLNVSSENNENSIWKNMCMTLSNDMKDPYLRAIFTLIGSDMDFSTVLRDKSLSMCDKLGIALRYLDDEKVPFL